MLLFAAVDAMPTDDPFESSLPVLAARLKRLPLARLPTPVGRFELTLGRERLAISVKQDNLTSDLYGGNKVRKLSFILPRAMSAGAQRVATFGAAGSNHVLATALHAARCGLGCTAFLSGQPKSPAVTRTLLKHCEIGTELVRYGGSAATRRALLRRHLWHRRAWVIPMGGSSWLGTMGFVAAGLELAAQVRQQDLPEPERIYVAAGTLGTAAGIAIGLAIAGSSATVHAVRVSDVSIASDEALRRLVRTTVSLMRHFDPQIAGDLADRTRLVLRNEFFGSGYALPGAGTERAIGFAADALGLELDITYTGKAFAALLADCESGANSGREVLYWHTRNAAPIRLANAALDKEALPEAFAGYL